MWIQAMILTLTRVADGFIVTNWSVTLATFPSISTRFAGGLLNYVLGQFLFQLMTRKKGVLTESLFLPWTMQNMSLRNYPLRLQDRPS